MDIWMQLENAERGERRPLEAVLAAIPWNADGLITAIAQQHDSGEVLMLAWMNREALRETLATGRVCYWSRSRQKLWKKGESSGMFQKVRRLLIDDDQDCLILEVTLTRPDAGGDEASCHVGYRSCFYREIVPAKADDEPPRLLFIEEKKAFDPEAVYGDTANPTRL